MIKEVRPACKNHGEDVEFEASSRNVFECLGKLHCERASNTYDGLTCPEGHYKIPEDQFATNCDDKGLPCPEGFTCYCQPCVKAYEVDVFPWSINNEETDSSSENHNRCDKVSLCSVWFAL